MSYFICYKNIEWKENIFANKFSNLFNKVVFLTFQFYILFIILTYFLEDYTGSINFNTSWENFYNIKISYIQASLF